MPGWIRLRDGGCQAVLADINVALWGIRNLLSQSLTQEKLLMSQITDWAAKEQADLTAISNTLNSIVQGIAALGALITTFQNSPGTLAPADQAALDAIQKQSDALVAQSAAISVAPPGPSSQPVGATS